MGVEAESEKGSYVVHHNNAWPWGEAGIPGGGKKYGTPRGGINHERRKERKSSKLMIKKR